MSAFLTILLYNCSTYKLVSKTTVDRKAVTNFPVGKPHISPYILEDSTLKVKLFHTNSIKFPSQLTTPFRNTKGHLSIIMNNI